MPRKKTSKSPGTSAKLKRISGLKLLVVVVLLLLVGLATFVGVKYYNYRQEVARDKDRFAEANVALVQEYEKIKNLIGAPENEEKDSYCKYANRKFGRGPISCVIVIHSWYHKKEFNTITRVLAQAYESQPTADDKMELNIKRLERKLRSGESGMVCGLSVNKNDEEKVRTLMSLFCHDNARSAHFPIRN